MRALSELGAARTAYFEAKILGLESSLDEGSHRLGMLFSDLQAQLQRLGDVHEQLQHARNIICQQSKLISINEEFVVAVREANEAKELVAETAQAAAAAAAALEAEELKEKQKKPGGRQRRHKVGKVGSAAGSQRSAV